jgi:hypothetical protein
MAVAYITEFSGILGSNAQVADGLISHQTVAIGAEADSVAFASGTRIIRIHVDVAAHFTLGTAPTATTSMARIAADQTEYLGVRTGEKLSIIAA